MASSRKKAVRSPGSAPQNRPQPSGFVPRLRRDGYFGLVPHILRPVNPTAPPFPKMASFRKSDRVHPAWLHKNSLNPLGFVPHFRRNPYFATPGKIANELRGNPNFRPNPSITFNWHSYFPGPKSDIGTVTRTGTVPCRFAARRFARTI